MDEKFPKCSTRAYQDLKFAHLLLKLAPQIGSSNWILKLDPQIGLFSNSRKAREEREDRMTVLQAEFNNIRCEDSSTRVSIPNTPAILISGEWHSQQTTPHRISCL